jgi:4-amino-4-deoxy-L-arabinose transferase-like glycosyltransferase
VSIGIIAALTGLAIFTFGWLAIVFLSKGMQSVILVSAVAFTVRSMLALVSIYIVDLPGSGRDDQGFHEVAAQLSGLDWGHLLNEGGTGKRLYEMVVAIAYKTFGVSLLVPLSINIMAGTLTATLVQLMSLKLWGNERVALSAGLVTALFPTLAIYSALLLRDSVMIFLLTAGSYCLVVFVTDRKLALYLLGCICWVGALAFHSGMVAAIPALVVALAFALSRENSASPHRTMKLLLFAGLVSVLLALVPLSTGWGMDKFRRYQDMELAEAVAEQQTARDHRNRAAYLQDLHPTSGFDLLWQTPIRVVYFVFTPFPWMVASGTDVFGLLVMLLGAWLLWRLFRARREVMANRSALLVLFTAACLVVVFAVGVTNYGTAIRHRTKVVPLLLVCIPVFFAARKRPRYIHDADGDAVVASYEH